MYCPPRASLLLCMFVGLLAAGALRAADQKDAKTKAVAWLDDYRKRQVLFHDEDIAALRKELEDATNKEAEEWLERTAKTRGILDSPKWLDMQRYLKEFLKVQAIYSEKQIDEFRERAREAVKDNPAEFKGMLQDLVEKRKALASGAANAERLREQQLAVNEAFRQQAFQEREAARRAAAQTAKSAPTTQPQKVRQIKPAHRPLVDSLDAARWSVMRNFWRGW